MVRGCRARRRKIAARGSRDEGVPDDLPAADLLDALIDALAAAPSGSRELDIRLDYGLGIMLSGRTDLATTMIREGISWQTVSGVLDSRVPAYTTSLDAAVEGEDIAFTIRSERRGKWGAMHRARCGKEVLVWAATEPLARRLAALEGRRADVLQAREIEQAQGEADSNGRAGAPDVAGATAQPASRESVYEPRARYAGAGHGDWKILF
jgi:hypothetical protein